MGPATIGKTLGVDTRRVQNWAGTYGPPKGNITTDQAKALQSLHSDRKNIQAILRQGAKNLSGRRTQAAKAASDARTKRGLVNLLKAKLAPSDLRTRRNPDTRKQIIDALLDIGAEPHDRDTYLSIPRY